MFLAINVTNLLSPTTPNYKNFIQGDKRPNINGELSHVYGFEDNTITVLIPSKSIYKFNVTSENLTNILILIFIWKGQNSQDQ